MSNPLASRHNPHPAPRYWRDMLLLLTFRPDRLVAIGWWWLSGKRLRARYRLSDAIAALPFAIQRWMSDCGRDDLADLGKTPADTVAAAFCVHLHVPDGMSASEVLKACKSVRRQSVQPLHLLVTAEGNSPALPDGMSAIQGRFTSRMDGLREALQQAQEAGARFLIPLPENGELPQHAVAAYAAHFLHHGGDPDAPHLLYGDQQALRQDGRQASSWLKPEWDRRMIWSQDYLSASCALPVDAALAVMATGDGRTPLSVYECILRLLRDVPTLTVSHVPRITARTAAGDWRSEGVQRLEAVQRLSDSSASAVAGPFATVRLQYALPRPLPKVSIIVATRDRVELLRTCAEGVLHETDYPEIELIIADNDSREAETLEYMDEVSSDPRVRVVRWPHPFNYSAINNFAAGSATGEYLCLLNNDIEVIEPQWLTELVREAAQPGVGAVGARLLYPDRSIQHAGVAIGIGNAAGHAHRGLVEGEPGYYAQALIARGASAVTGACLLVAKRHFDAVGGLDEDELAVAYNDVDFCLKLRQRGLDSIYTPAATLIHHESKSRGLDFAPEHLQRYMRELAVFQKRWSTDVIIDPWHHPRLDRNNEVYGEAG